MKNEIKSKVEELNSMILKGQILEAFKKFYAPEVVMQENSKTPTIGFEANLEREKDFVSKVQWNSAKVKSITIGEDSSAIEWDLDYTHKEWGHVKMTQVALQKWKNGKIFYERFFYGP